MEKSIEFLQKKFFSNDKYDDFINDLYMKIKRLISYKIIKKVMILKEKW